MYLALLLDASRPPCVHIIFISLLIHLHSLSSPSSPLTVMLCLGHQDGVSNTCTSLFAVPVCML